MVKKFTIPFASQGDANDIPDALQVDGKVSFTQGFGYDYERPYDDPQAKDIAREDMNGLFKAITSAVGELQTLGASEWSSAISYPKGAIVYYEKDLYISQVDDNQNTPPQNWVSITSIANDSLKKAANLSDLTNKATARNNLGLGSSATLNKTDVLGTSTSLVATQKLVNDTKINLDNSKQDKLTFTGTGNVARMSEVEKKMDVDAGGLLADAKIPKITFSNHRKPQFYYVEGGTDHPKEWGFGVAMHHHYNNQSAFLHCEGGSFEGDISIHRYTSSNYLKHTLYTSVNSSTFSSKAKYVDVSSSRSANTNYTNNTDRVIAVSFRNHNYAVGLCVALVDGVSVFSTYRSKVLEEIADPVGYFLVPPGSSYRINVAGGKLSWYEMR